MQLGSQGGLTLLGKITVAWSPGGWHRAPGLRGRPWTSKKTTSEGMETSKEKPSTSLLSTEDDLFEPYTQELEAQRSHLHCMAHGCSRGQQEKAGEWGELTLSLLRQAHRPVTQQAHGAEKGFKERKKWDPNQAWQFGNGECGYCLEVPGVTARQTDLPC